MTNKEFVETFDAELTDKEKAEVVAELDSYKEKWWLSDDVRKKAYYQLHYDTLLIPIAEFNEGLQLLFDDDEINAVRIFMSGIDRWREISHEVSPYPKPEKIKYENDDAEEITDF